MTEPLQILRREGIWVYIDEASARRHPLYGIKGWARFLWVVFVVLGPILGFGEFMKGILEAHKNAVTVTPIEVWTTVIQIIIFVLYGWFLAYLLSYHKASFVFHYVIYSIVIFVLSGSVLILSEVTSEVTAAIKDIIGASIWLVYVLMSKRINVTTAKRVRADDPILSSATGS